MIDGHCCVEQVTATGAAGSNREARLSLRDWILLPIISLVTISIMAASTELFSRRVFRDGRTSLASCTVLTDYSAGTRTIPNTVCWEKLPEGQLTEYRFNSCGHRAGKECGPRQPGAYRIVLTGTSMVLGRYVDIDKIFAALLPAELSRLTGRKVDIYSEGMEWGFLNSVDLRFSEVLAAKPDMVLWVITARDFRYAAFVSNEAIWQGDNKAVALPESAGKAGSLARVWYRIKFAYANNSIEDELRNHLSLPGTALLLRHFLYESPTQYVKSFLMGANDAEFLRVEPNTDWQAKLKQFDSIDADIEAQAKTAGVPVVAVLLPMRSQAAMISMGEWPAGYDPYKIDNELRPIITKHGGIYLDILPDYREIPGSAQGYYPVDGHPNADGHRMISELLAKALTSGAVPALGVAPQQQTELGKGK